MVFKCPTLSSDFVCKTPLLKNNPRRFLSSTIKLVYTVFTRISAAALISFFAPQVPRLFKHCTRQIYFFYIFIQRYTFYLLIFLWTGTKLIVNLYRTCGVHLNSQTYNSLVLDKSLFYSLPVLQRVLLYLFTQETYFIITRVSDYNLHNLVILAVNYENRHALTTLPFTLP